MDYMDINRGHNFNIELKTPETAVIETVGKVIGDYINYRKDVKIEAEREGTKRKYIEAHKDVIIKQIEAQRDYLFASMKNNDARINKSIDMIGGVINIEMAVTNPELVKHAIDRMVGLTLETSVKTKNNMSFSPQINQNLLKYNSELEL